MSIIHLNRLATLGVERNMLTEDVNLEVVGMELGESAKE